MIGNESSTFSLKKNMSAGGKRAPLFAKDVDPFERMMKEFQVFAGKVMESANLLHSQFERAFRRFDVDGSGTISKSELPRVISDLMHPDDPAKQKDLEDSIAAFSEEFDLVTPVPPSTPTLRAVRPPPAQRARIPAFGITTTGNPNPT